MEQRSNGWFWYIILGLRGGKCVTLLLSALVGSGTGDFRGNRKQTNTTQFIRDWELPALLLLETTAITLLFVAEATSITLLLAISLAAEAATLAEAASLSEAASHALPHVLSSAARHVVGARPTVTTFTEVEAHLVTLLQRVALDLSRVDEDLLTILSDDEAETLRLVVELAASSVRHLVGVGLVDVPI